MPINANVTGQPQITAKVGETKIDVSVSGGVGPTGSTGATGPAGTTTWAGITDKPSTFTPSAHTHVIGDVTGLQTALDGKQAAGNYATLVDGTIPAGQLPSYVDDVIAVSSYGDLPSPGEQGKIYVITGTNRCYRWSGFVYVEIVPSPGSTDAVPEGSVNLYYTNTRAAAAAPVQSVNGKTGTVALTHTDVTAAASSHTHTLSAITDAGTAAGKNVPASGDASSTQVVLGSDTRLTDARTPTSHTHSYNTLSDLPTLFDGSYTSLSNVPSTFSPSAHSHAISDVTDLATTLSGKAPASDFDQALKTTSDVEFASVVASGSKNAATVTVTGDAIQFAMPGATSGLTTLARSGLTFGDASIQTTAWTGSVDWANVSSKPTLFDGAYTSLTSVPSTFAPSAHKTSHATGGSDALTASDIGAAAASHVHSATADLTFSGATAGQVLTVNSGATALVWATPTTYTLPTASNSVTGGVRIGSGVSIDGSGVISVSTAYAATSHTHGNITNAGAIGSTSGLPIITTTSGVLTTGAFGTSSGQFAAGDHTHSQLHDRSHAITSTSDHTAGNWKVIYTNGSGQVVELALGAANTVLQSNGTSSAPSFAAVSGESFHPFLLAGM